MGRIPHTKDTKEEKNTKKNQGVFVRKPDVDITIRLQTKIPSSSFVSFVSL